MVAIVGRPNVGKSSLLNALAGRLISIVQDMPGVTRDRIAYPLPVPLHDGKDAAVRYVELLDTGGYGFTDPTGLTEHIHHQIELAIARADLVLFVVDCQAGLTAADEHIARLLRERGLKVVLLANKADGDKADLSLSDFARLGFGTPLGISALNKRHLDDVFAAIRDNLPLERAPAELPEPDMHIAIVGKRNAGKSTLVNAIARIYEGEDADRVIVSEVPGTTRDSVDVRFEKDGHTLVVIDTAGVRKKRHMVTNDIEFYSFHRAERSIRRADVVLLLIDATEPVSEPDKKLAAYIASQYKPVVIVINKWDLARAEFSTRADADGQPFDDTAAMAKYRDYLDKTLRHVDFAPIAFITARDGKNVQQVLDLARHLHKQASQRLGTGRLNAAIAQVFTERTPSHPSGKRPRVYYATQTGINPPEIVLFVNNPSLITETYQRFLLNRLRELLPYPEVPIKLAIRGKGTSGKPAPGQSAPAAPPPGSPKRPIWDGTALEHKPAGGLKPPKPPKPGKPLPRRVATRRKPGRRKN
ncbi:MAG: ribosome biogenesis GTPase Der [Tepidisphaerales bacterium]